MTGCGRRERGEVLLHAADRASLRAVLGVGTVRWPRLLPEEKDVADELAWNVIQRGFLLEGKTMADFDAVARVQMSGRNSGIVCLDLSRAELGSESGQKAWSGPPPHPSLHRRYKAVTLGTGTAEDLVPGLSTLFRRKDRTSLFREV